MAEPNKTDHEDNDLIAYLNGELDESASATVEMRLAKDNKYRRELDLHQESWRMLDQLPRLTASEQMTSETIGLVLHRSQHGGQDQRRRLDVGRVLALSGWFVLLVILVITGLMTGRSTAPPKSEMSWQQLMMYEHIPDLHVLRRIADADVSGTLPSISGLNLNELEARTRYSNLSVEAQSRISEFQDQVTELPDSERDRLLSQGMRYAAWYEFLPMHLRLDVDLSIPELQGHLDDVQQRMRRIDAERPYWLMNPGLRSRFMRMHRRLTVEQVERLDQISPFERQRLLAPLLRFGDRPDLSKSGISKARTEDARSRLRTFLSDNPDVMRELMRDGDGDLTKRAVELYNDRHGDKPIKLSELEEIDSVLPSRGSRE